MTRRVALTVVAVGLLLGACKSDSNSPSLGTLPPRPATTTSTTAVPAGAAAGAYAFSRATTNHTSGTFREKPLDRTTNSSGTQKVTYSVPSGDKQYAFTREGTFKVDQILEYKADETQLAGWRISQNYNTVRFVPTPSVTLFPAGLAVGSKWNWKITSLAQNSARQTRTASYEAVRTEDLTINGVTVSCIVINGTMTIDYGSTATQKTTDWYSPQLKFVVQQNQITDYHAVGRGKDLQVHLDQTTKLLDTRPNHI